MWRHRALLLSTQRGHARGGAGPGPARPGATWGSGVATCLDEPIQASVALIPPPMIGGGESIRPFSSLGYDDDAKTGQSVCMHSAFRVTSN
jgi:hypothetical protein